MPILEFRNERFILEDFGTVCGGTARESRDAAVNSIGGDVVEDSPLKIINAETIGHGTWSPGGSGMATNLLASAASTHLRVLEDSDQMLQVVRIPEDVIISPDNDAGLNVLKGSDHLCSLTKTGNTQNSDVAEVLGIAERTARQHIRFQDDNKDLLRSTGRNT